MTFVIYNSTTGRFDLTNEHGVVLSSHATIDQAHTAQEALA